MRTEFSFLGELYL